MNLINQFQNYLREKSWELAGQVREDFLAQRSYDHCSLPTKIVIRLEQCAETVHFFTSPFFRIFSSKKETCSYCSNPVNCKTTSWYTGGKKIEEIQIIPRKYDENTEYPELRITMQITKKIQTCEHIIHENCFSSWEKSTSCPFCSNHPIQVIQLSPEEITKFLNLEKNKTHVHALTYNTQKKCMDLLFTNQKEEDLINIAANSSSIYGFFMLEIYLEKNPKNFQTLEKDLQNMFYTRYSIKEIKETYKKKYQDFDETMITLIANMKNVDQGEIFFHFQQLGQYYLYKNQPQKAEYLLQTCMDPSHGNSAALSEDIFNFYAEKAYTTEQLDNITNFLLSEKVTLTWTAELYSKIQNLIDAYRIFAITKKDETYLIKATTLRNRLWNPYQIIKGSRTIIEGYLELSVMQKDKELLQKAKKYIDDLVINPEIGGKNCCIKDIAGLKENFVEKIKEYHKKYRSHFLLRPFLKKYF